MTRDEAKSRLLKLIGRGEDRDLIAAAFSDLVFWDAAPGESRSVLDAGLDVDQMAACAHYLTGTPWYGPLSTAILYRISGRP